MSTTTLYQESTCPNSLLVNLPSSFVKAFPEQVVAPLPLLPYTIHPIISYRMLYDILLISDITAVRHSVVSTKGHLIFGCVV